MSRISSDLALYKHCSHAFYLLLGGRIRYDTRRILYTSIQYGHALRLLYGGNTRYGTRQI